MFLLGESSGDCIIKLRRSHCSNNPSQMIASGPHGHDSDQDSYYYVGKDFPVVRTVSYRGIWTDSFESGRQSVWFTSSVLGEPVGLC